MTSAGLLGTVAALGLVGLLGSLGHCVGMCGPLVILAGSRFPKKGLPSAPYHLLYNLAKAGVYTILGVLAGGLGSLAFHASGGGQLFSAVSFIGGIAVILSGAVYLGWIRLGSGSLLGGLWKRGAQLVSRLSGPGRAMAFGALNGLLPCGLVYSGLLVAAASGSLLAGGLGMLVFGLGTMPSLLLIGVGAGLITLQTRRVMARVAGVFVMFVGAQLILRGFAGLGLLPHTPIVEALLW